LAHLSPKLSKRTLFVLLCASACPWACKTPEQYSQDADQETYALIDQRREAMFQINEAFRLENSTSGARARAIQGELTVLDDLSIVSCMGIAAESSSDYLQQKESLYIEALGLTQERWNFGVREDLSAGDALSGTGSEPINASTDGSWTFSKVLGGGANIVLGIGSSLARVVTNGDSWDVVSNLSLSITQPLMRAAGRKITLEPLTQAERSLVYRVRSYERFRRTFGVNVARQVFGVLEAIDQLKNQETNLENLILLRKRNQRLAEAGQMSDIESDQAKQDELRSINSLVELRGNLEQQLDNFKLFLGLPISLEVSLDRNEFDRLDDSTPLLDRLDQETAVRMAFENRLDVRTSEDQLEDSLRNLEIAADSLRPGLGLIINANSASPDGRPLDHRRDDIGWSLGFDLDPAWDDLPERNAFRRAEISYTANLRDHERFLDRIELEVREALRNTRNSKERYQIQRGAMELSERRVRSVDLLLQAGRASTRDLLEARESLLSSSNATTSALIDLELAKFDLQLALEVMRVDETGIYTDAEAIEMLPPAPELAPIEGEIENGEE